MNNQAPVVADQQQVQVWNKYLNNRRETHLEFSLWFVTASGDHRCLTGNIEWGFYEESDSLCNKILNLQTPFVRQRWFHLEVHIPNRDQYGQLRPGFIKDTGFLLVKRELLH